MNGSTCGAGGTDEPSRSAAMISAGSCDSRTLHLVEQRLDQLAGVQDHLAGGRHGRVERGDRGTSARSPVSAASRWASCHELSRHSSIVPSTSQSEIRPKQSTSRSTGEIRSAAALSAGTSEASTVLIRSKSSSSAPIAAPGAMDAGGDAEVELHVRVDRQHQVLEHDQVGVVRRVEGQLPGCADRFVALPAVQRGEVPPGERGVEALHARTVVEQAFGDALADAGGDPGVQRGEVADRRSRGDRPVDHRVELDEHLGDRLRGRGC